MSCFDIRSVNFSSRIVPLGLAFFLASAFAGCNQNSTSDFLKRQQVQENAISALTDLGARVKKEDTGQAQAWTVDLSQMPFTSEIATQLKLLENSMGMLNLSNTSIDDNQLADLIDQKALGTVVKLDLSNNSAITDQSLAKIASLFNLHDLDLVGTQVTEEGIARLQQQRKPRQITDDMMKSIKSKPEKIQKSTLEALKRELRIRH